MGSILCPECRIMAKFEIIRHSNVTTVSIKCDKCNRRVIKSGKHDESSVTRKIAIETWHNIFGYEEDD